MSADYDAWYADWTRDHPEIAGQELDADHDPNDIRHLWVEAEPDHDREAGS